MPSGGRPCDQYIQYYYSPSVVTRDGECIALNIDALHDLEVKEPEVLNAYKMTPYKKRSSGSMLVSLP